MGVIKRFAISSVVLGVLAIAGGASALAFEGESAESPAVQPVDGPAGTSETPSDVESDVPAEVLPDTGGPSGARGWVAPNGR